MEKFRYKGNTTNTFGVHIEFIKILIKDIDTFSGTLNLPKPWNHAEIAMLSKFIFGVELSCNFEYCHDIITDLIYNIENPKFPWMKPTAEEIKFLRFLKLYRMNSNKEDYIKKDNKKMNLVDLRYICNIKQFEYNDYNFNKEVFGSSYEMDSYFWRHCIGELTCGGVATYSYGQVSIKSYKESQRILNIFDNPKESVRDSFRKKIEELIKLDKQYDEKSLEV